MPLLAALLHRRRRIGFIGRCAPPVADRAGQAVHAALNVSEQADIFLRHQPALLGLGVFGNKPPLAMAIRYPDNLALDQRQLILVLTLKIKQCHCFAVEFLIRRCNGKLVVSGVARFISILIPGLRQWA